MWGEASGTEEGDAKVGLSSAKRVFERFVMRLRDWLERRQARRLYWKICRANYIILRELHGNAQNRPYRSELEACADALELAACNVKRRFNTDA